MANELWLPNWRVLDASKPRSFDEPKVFSAECLDAPEACKHCGCVGRLYRHGVITLDYRHLPAYRHRVIIRAKVGRYRCRECGKTMMQPLTDMDPARGMSKQLVEWIGYASIDDTYASIAREIDVDEKTVRNISDDYIDRRMSEHTVEAPLVLGIDELTLMGQKRAIFVDIDGKRLLDIIPTMDQAAVARWLTLLPNRQNVRIVTMDMHGPYADVVRDLMPRAKIVIDKWHVVSKANEKLDIVRNRHRRAGKTKAARRNPHRGRRLLQAHGKNLSPHRRFVLDGVLLNNPLLKDAWEAKEGFYAIWEAKSPHEAERLFDAWAASIPSTVPEFKDLFATVDKRRGPIFEYFRYPFTNAYTEARNRLVKDFARAGRGYAFKRIRAKAILKQNITSQPNIYCYLCMRPVDMSGLTMVHPHTVGTPRERMMCKRCTANFHMWGEYKRLLDSTRNSG